jgi:5-formyltetrahydrofolate cyclo-ligase
MSAAPPDLAELRRAARSRRAALTDAERAAGAAAVRDLLLADPRCRRATRLAAYLAVGSELDLRPTIAAFAARCELYLPRLRPVGRRMAFARYSPGDPLVANRHRIPEPAGTAPTTAPRFLDVVLVPLVAFDGLGNRLGSGAGYYDATLASRNAPGGASRPALYGIGFACQRASGIPARSWDVPLDAVVTELGIERFR